MSVVRRSQPDIGSSSSLNRFQIDGDVVQARGVRLALDPSIAGLESSLLRPLLAVVNFLPDKSGRDDRGRRLPTAQSDRNVLGEPGDTRIQTKCAILDSPRSSDGLILISVG